MKPPFKLSLRGATRRHVASNFEDDLGRTKQGFQNECDVNRIVKRFHETGMPPPFLKGEGGYGFAPSQTFTEAMQMVASVKSQFEGMPSRIRTHFDNDPAKFLDAAHDPDRTDELIELGLLPEPESELVTEPLIEPPEAPKTEPESPESASN